MKALRYLKKQNRKLAKKLKAYFSNKEILELFLRFGYSELSEEELNKVNKWANAYDDRVLIFENLKKTIEFDKQLANVQMTEIRAILKNLKEDFPLHFAEIPDNTSSVILMMVLPGSVKQLNYEYAYGIVYGNIFIRVISLLVRIAIVVLAILIVREAIFR